ncbi:Uncharacterised protein [Streptococcus pneumoniae]|uniref:Uncharacterized protein n=1 Tax=Streptococcus pneumoniae TaxID=1313 RepID=A0A4V0JU67_STREE|nr:hypothetical protein [Streptococcus pneumoniae]ANO37497.1 hypothetical protein SPND219_02319 [Streptococcus pneumoniae]AOG56502.1 hypothetical protein SPND122_02211 [Streptococcus pneumoniae]AOG58665.1 hypothetical protein SPND141_01651 [Streptococcus pneumoniae]MDA2878194.1 hypothetical protein [Streptococcus pneumoniae]MDD0786436.1 hypothetical protein [Streptococcus pneumoniae]
MNNKKICRLISICLAIFSAILAVVLFVWGERGQVFIAMVPLFLSKFVDNIGKNK